MMVPELTRTWREKAEALRRYAPVAAEAFEECARDLETVRPFDLAGGDQLLTLREAARESGYTENHLGKLVASGQLPNAGRAHAPRIRRRHLPRKPGMVADHGR